MKLIYRVPNIFTVKFNKAIYFLTVTSKKSMIDLIYLKPILKRLLASFFDFLEKFSNGSKYLTHPLITLSYQNWIKSDGVC